MWVMEQLVCIHINQDRKFRVGARHVGLGYTNKCQSALATASKFFTSSTDVKNPPYSSLQTVRQLTV